MALLISSPRRRVGAFYAVLVLCLAAGVRGVRTNLDEDLLPPLPDEGPVQVIGATDGAYFSPNGPDVAWPVLPEQRLSWRRWLMALGGGTGATIGDGSGSQKADLRLLQRMRAQDKAVMFLLLLAYLGSLLFSARFAYRQSCNNSPVKYYADPRVSIATTEEEDLDSFLQAFNVPPQDAQLQVTGLMPMPHLPEYMLDTAVWWLNGRYRVAFSFGLDLAQWLKRDPGNQSEGETAARGVATEDLERLSSYLANDANDLSYVSLHQDVAWKDWEELATNIKSQIRQSGFTGVVHVQKKPAAVIAVHKNRAWANFMHNRTTKVILVLSVFGWFFQQLYMFLRHRGLDVHCKFIVDVKIVEYWPLIADKIGPAGFNSGVATPTPRRQQQHQRRWEQPSPF